MRLIDSSAGWEAARNPSPNQLLISDSLIFTTTSPAVLLMSGVQLAVRSEPASDWSDRGDGGGGAPDPFIAASPPARPFIRRGCIPAPPVMMPRADNGWRMGGLADHQRPPPAVYRPPTTSRPPPRLCLPSYSPVAMARQIRRQVSSPDRRHSRSCSSL